MGQKENHLTAQQIKEITEGYTYTYNPDIQFCKYSVAI